MQEGLNQRDGQPQERSREDAQVACDRLCRQAVAALNLGGVGQAQRLADQAVKTAEESRLMGDLRRSVRVSTLCIAATVHENSGALGESLGYLEKAITVQAADLDPSKWDSTLHDLNIQCAKLLAAMGRKDEADSRWGGVIARIADQPHELLLHIDTRLNYAAFLRECGREGNANREMISAFGVLPRIEKSAGGELASLLVRHAESLGSEGRFGPAALLSGEALRRLRESGAPSESKAARDFLDDVRLRQADFLVKAGKIGEGRQAYESLLNAWRTEREPADSKLMQLRDDMSTMEAEVGNFPRAQALAQENLQVALDDGSELFQRNARALVASIYRLQGRYRDAYEVVKPKQRELEGESGSESGSEYRVGDDVEEEREVSIEDRLRDAERLPMPYRTVRRANILARGAAEIVEEDPEQALALVGRAQEELDGLAPGLTQRIARVLGDIRAKAVANLGGLPKQIEFEKRKLEDFVKAYGCSREFTRQYWVRDLAALHIQNENYAAAEELLRDVKGFLELRGANKTLLYGTTLLLLAGIIDDQQDAQSLRDEGEIIVDSLRDQTDFNH